MQLGLQQQSGEKLMNRSLALSAILGLVTAACSSQSAEPTSAPAATTDFTAPPQAAPAANAIGRGYVHDEARSRFALGAMQSVVQAGHYRRIVGSDGTIAVTDTGATLAVLNA